MDRALADKLMRATDSVNAALNRTAEIVEGIADHDEKRRYRAAVAQLMADVYIRIMAPIVGEHQDLDPDK